MSALFDLYWKENKRLSKLVPDHAFAVRDSDVDEMELLLYNDTHTVHTRNLYMSHALEDRLGLPPAYPTALTKVTAKFAFKVTRPSGRLCYHTFHSIYAARHFLDMIIDTAEFRWIDDHRIEMEDGTVIKGEIGDDLQDAIEHELTAKEKQWHIPEPNRTYHLAFMGRRRVKDIDIPSQIPAPHTPPVKQRRQPAAESKPAEKVARAIKKPSGLVSIADVCSALNSDARTCRALLRQLKVEKPAHGWAWSEADAAIIKERLRPLIKR